MEEALHARLRELLSQDPSQGYRGLHALVKEDKDFKDVGLKKVQNAVKIVREQLESKPPPASSLTQPAKHSAGTGEVVWTAASDGYAAQEEDIRAPIDTFEICIQWHPETFAMLRYIQADALWTDSEKHMVPANISVAELGDQMSMKWEDLYYEQFNDQAQMQIDSFFSPSNLQTELPFTDYVKQHIAPGGCVIAKAYVMTAEMIKGMNPQFWEERRKTFRSELRFDLNDRVICNCGDRWMSGHVVGTAVGENGDFLPYLVKTDRLPGLESGTISVPDDSDDVVTQEVCFDHTLGELHLIQVSTPIVPQSKRSAMRFGIGDRVVCRMRNARDGLENWCRGTISELWQPMPGPFDWEMDGMRGQFADAVPYRVTLDSGKWIYCQADKHTLIRREDMEPQTRVKGLSKRMEVRHLPDGGREKVDHMTGRRKLLLDESESDDDD
jgi:hypothetical protein